MTSKTHVIIYTDGACSGNPGPGGWGAILISGKHRKELSGGSPETTNNRMELMGVIEALRALKNRCDVAIYTDSIYVKDGATKWLANWKARGWRTAGKKDVKNIDLWQQLDALLTDHEIEWHWVKGHAGDPENERADALAREAIPVSN